MKVTEVTVTASRTFSHPEQRHNDTDTLKAEVSLKGVIQDGEDPFDATQGLQALAEHLVSVHRNLILEGINSQRRRADRERDLVTGTPPF